MIYGPSGVSYWDQLMASLAYWAATDARLAILSLLNSFGDSTEPDFTVIAPVYDRMLAIAMLLLGAVVAFGLIERIVGGAHGVGWAVVGRVVAAVFFAYTGLAVVQYIAAYSALLATTWTPDFLALANAVGPAGDPTGVAGGLHQGRSVLGLILTALLLAFLALMVYLELIVRSALILTVTAFVPLVCALSIWPRMASSAVHLGEFLIGLLLSKFVVATALYVGLHLVVPALIKGQSPAGKADWMESGVAVLLIAAFSPLVLFQALHFAHGSAGTVARSLGSAGVGAMPIRTAVGVGQRLFRQAKRHPNFQATEAAASNGGRGLASKLAGVARRAGRR